MPVLALALTANAVLARGRCRCLPARKKPVLALALTANAVLAVAGSSSLAHGPRSSLTKSNLIAGAGLSPVATTVEVVEWVRVVVWPVLVVGVITVWPVVEAEWVLVVGMPLLQAQGAGGVLGEAAAWAQVVAAAWAQAPAAVAIRVEDLALAVEALSPSTRWHWERNPLHRCLLWLGHRWLLWFGHTWLPWLVQRLGAAAAEALGGEAQMVAVAWASVFAVAWAAALAGGRQQTAAALCVGPRYAPGSPVASSAVGCRIHPRPNGRSALPGPARGA